MPETAGQRLKRIRISRHLSIDQVFQATHIRPRFIEALENDDLAPLPSLVQARGFLRLYVDFLGLPHQPILDAWDKKGILETEDETPIEEDLAVETAPISNLPPTDDLQTNNDAVTSEAIFREIGKTLRRQREAISISLNDLEQHLHIRVAFLQALEEGRIDDLPSLAQGRGMLANYAHFLELDVDTILLRFADALQIRREEKTGKKEVVKKNRNHTAQPSGPVRRLITPDMMIGSLAIIVFAAIIIWTAARVSATRQQEFQITPPSIAEVLLITPSATPDTNSGLTPTSVATLAEDAQGQVVENSDLTTPTGIPLLDDLPLQVYVIAVQRSWMRVISDGKTAFNGRAIPGNAYPFSGKEKIELTTGNAAGLQVYFNQNNLGSLGVFSQVVNLVFSKQGIQTPTLASTPTTTISPTPTITLTPTRTVAVPTATVTPYVP
jgi:cytoskeleton protein RodZ